MLPQGVGGFTVAIICSYITAGALWLITDWSLTRAMVAGFGSMILGKLYMGDDDD